LKARACLCLEISTTDMRRAADACGSCDALPGFAFNQAINSFKLFAGVAFFATIS